MASTKATQSPPLQRRFLTAAELAAEIGVPADTIRAWIAAGELEAVNVGKGADRPRWRIAQDAADRFLARRTKPAATPTAPLRPRKQRPVKEYF